MQIVDPDIEYYAERHTSPESSLLQELAQKTAEELEYSEMLTGRVEGRLLNLLVLLTGCRRILEIGTFTGYSALSMAGALPEDGQIITCEINERYEKIARSYFKRSEHGSKIELRMGPALETIQTLEGPLDLVFIDADKVNYPRYYKQVLPKVKTDGLFVVDNVFWSGDVLNPGDEKSKAIDRLNRMIAEDENVEQVVLTVRDGLTLVRKIQ